MVCISDDAATRAASVAPSLEGLRLLAASLESAREEECARLAQILEDEVGQPLAAANLALAQLSASLAHGRGARAAEHQARALFGLVSGCLESVERISTQLRPGVFDDFGFVAALEWHAREFENATGIRFVTDRPLCDPALPRHSAIAVFRIFKELLQNVAQHARATEVVISLRREKGWLALEVRDDGRGITPAQIADTKALGLLRISERAWQLGGVIQFRGVAPHGTAVTLRIPLPKRRRGR